MGGAVVAADPAQVEKLRYWANVVGSAVAPFDAWLTLRGLRTLFPRMEQQQINAMSVANFLEKHRAVAKVHFPGLASHPGNAIASRQRSEERRVGKEGVSTGRSGWRTYH